MRHKMKIWAGLAVLAALVLTAAMFRTTSLASAAGNDSHWGANYFPNVTLTTQDGKQVKFYDDLLKGKIVAIELFYTHCLDICPLETARLAQVQTILGDRVGKDIFFYSLSIDPERDTPQELKAFAEKYHAGPGWTFLTGKKEDIDLISKKLGLYKAPDPTDRDGHAPHLLIGNEATGQWMRNNALDNPKFMAVLIGDWLNNWTSAKLQTSHQSYEQATRLTLDPGQYLYSTQCAACHTMGHGDTIGPDLLGITKIRDPKWLTRIIQVPDTLLAEGDPLATGLFEKYKKVRMPNLHLDKEATQLVISYMEAQSAARAPAGSAGRSKP
jgi:protein SCO1/2